MTATIQKPTFALCACSCATIWSFCTKFLQYYSRIGANFSLHQILPFQILHVPTPPPPRYAVPSQLLRNTLFLLAQCTGAGVPNQPQGTPPPRASSTFSSQARVVWTPWSSGSFRDGALEAHKNVVPPLARAKSEQRFVLFPSNFGTLVLLSQGGGTFGLVCGARECPHSLKGVGGGVPLRLVGYWCPVLWWGIRGGRVWPGTCFLICILAAGDLPPPPPIHLKPALSVCTPSFRERLCAFDAYQRVLDSSCMVPPRSLDCR